MGLEMRSIRQIHALQRGHAGKAQHTLRVGHTKTRDHFITRMHFCHSGLNQLERGRVYRAALGKKAHDPLKSLQRIDSMRGIELGQVGPIGMQFLHLNFLDRFDLREVNNPHAHQEHRPREHSDQQ